MSSNPEANRLAADAELLNQINGDLGEAMSLLGSMAPGITVFGSARTPPNDAAYQCAERLGA